MKFCNRTKVEFAQHQRSFLIPCQFRKRLQRERRFLVLNPWYGNDTISQISTTKAEEVQRQSKSHPSSLPLRKLSTGAHAGECGSELHSFRVLQSWGKVLGMACLSPLPYFTPFILDLKALIRRNGNPSS